MGFGILKRKIVTLKLLDIISLTIGVFGVALSVYFYYASLLNRDLSFTVEDAVNIYDNSYQTSSIRISRRNGKAFEGNLYARTIRLVNTSDIDLNSSSIVRPINFFIESGSKQPQSEIIDVQIARGIKIASSNFEVSYYNTADKCQYRYPCLTLIWNVLNRGFGAEVVIFYTGRSDDKVELNSNFILTGIDHVANSDFTFAPDVSLVAGLAIVWSLFILLLANILAIRFTIKSFRQDTAKPIIISIMLNLFIIIPSIAGIIIIVILLIR